jgi:rhodanese-related sulfurtransferase
VPFVIIDIRDDKSSKLKQEAVRFRDAVQFSEALEDPTKWKSIAKGLEPFPATSHLLVFVHDSKVCCFNFTVASPVHCVIRERRQLSVQAPLYAAVSAAFNSNFVHCFTIPSKRLASAKTSEDVSEPRYISKHAVAHLISLKSVTCDDKAPILVDVRRHDERALFGCIQGSVHVPVEQLANALQEPPAIFEEVAGTPAWAKNDLLIFHSRESLRARWAAQLASERGVNHFPDAFKFHHGLCQGVTCFLDSTDVHQMNTLSLSGSHVQGTRMLSCVRKAAMA